MGGAAARAVPEHRRRALRHCLGVALPALVGFGAFIPQARPAQIAFAQACQWASITVCSVTMPVLAQVNQAGVERTLGTIIGGSLALVAFTIGSTYWNNATDGAVLSLIAALLSYFSILIGHRLGMELAARLFMQTFLLVAFGAQDGQDVTYMLLTRAGGIALGLLVSVVLAILVLPKSATMEAVHNLEQALVCLTQLNGLSWGSYLPGPSQQAAAGAAAGVARSYSAWARSFRPQSIRQLSLRDAGYEALPEDLYEGGSGDGATVSPQPARGVEHVRSGGNEGSAHGRAAEAHAEECEEVLTDVYQSLFLMRENCRLGKSELLLGSCRQRLVFVPGIPFVGMKSQHMPWEALAEAATAVRRVARLLRSVSATLGQGFERDMQAVLGEHFPEGLMERLAEAAQTAIQAMVTAWSSGRGPCPADCLAPLAVAVRELAQVSDYQRSRIITALHGGRRRSAAQHTWQQLLAGVRAQQAATRGAPAQPLRTQRSLSAPGLGAFEAAVDIENGGITAATTGAGEQQHAALQPPPAGLATRPAADAGLLREGGAVERAVAEDLASTSAKSSQHGGGAVQDAVPEARRLSSGNARSETLRLALFAETAEGYVAQIRWYTFQAELEDLLAELQGLRSSLDLALAELP